MSDEDEDAWGAELNGKVAPSVGSSKDVLRKARALNPALAAQGSTTELFSKVKDGQQRSAVAVATGQKAPAGRVDFATASLGISQWTEPRTLTPILIAIHPSHQSQRA